MEIHTQFQYWDILDTSTPLLTTPHVILPTKIFFKLQVYLLVFLWIVRWLQYICLYGVKKWRSRWEECWYCWLGKGHYVHVGREVCDNSWQEGGEAIGLRAFLALSSVMLRLLSIMLTWNFKIFIMFLFRYYKYSYSGCTGKSWRRQRALIVWLLSKSSWRCAGAWWYILY